MIFLVEGYIAARTLGHNRLAAIGLAVVNWLT